MVAQPISLAEAKAKYNGQPRDNFSRVPVWLLDHPTIGAYPIAVYTVLMRYARRETGRCYPSTQTIADTLNISRRTVQRALLALEHAGAVTIARGALQGKTRPVNGYQLHFRAPGDGDSDDEDRVSQTRRSRLTVANWARDRDCGAQEPDPDPIRTRSKKTRSKNHWCHPGQFDHLIRRPGQEPWMGGEQSDQRGIGVTWAP